MEDITLKLLNMRGIKSEDDISEFLSSKPKLTYSSMLLPDITEGVDRILRAIKDKKKIMIYGDYDCDGITSTSLIYEVLSLVTSKDNLSYYIPKRFNEGYGLNMEAIKKIYDMGFTFILTVDCGSTSFEEVNYAKSLGMDIVVTDHHNIDSKISDTLVINPKRPDSKYPFKELSGCGVIFKVVQVLVSELNLGKDVITRVLDLVALGTVSDIMELKDENRTLVKFGLRVINSGNRLGLKTLIEKTGLTLGNISSGNIGFGIAPYLNASGRMDDASIAVKLMISKDMDEINNIVDDLILKNLKRKELQNEAYKIGLDMLHDYKENFIFLRLDDSHEGILGIVAGKIKEEFNKPTIILSKIKDSDNLIKGTGRSIEGVNIYDILNKHNDLFLKFGGHSGACGFTIEEDNEKTLINSVINDIKSYDEKLFEVHDRYDLLIGEEDINLRLGEEIKLFEPFGKGNEKPRFKVKIEGYREVILMGKEGTHLKFLKNGIQYVLFNHAKDYDLATLENMDLELIGSIDVKTYKGEESVQFIIDKLRVI